MNGNKFLDYNMNSNKLIVILEIQIIGHYYSI